jgi:hypothetical protein
MKKLAFLLLLLSPAFAAPTFSGADGYIARPKADVADPLTLGVGLRYTLYNNANRHYLTPSLNFVPFKNFEVSSGYDILMMKSNRNEDPAWLLGIKYQFYEKKVNSALALNFEIPTGNLGTFPMELLWNVDYNILNFNITFGAGYFIYFNNGKRFGDIFPPNLNFYIGFERGIFVPEKIFVYGDFSNYPHRQAPAPPFGNENRGIFNLGLDFRLTEIFTFNIAGLDLFDYGSRSASLGIAFKFGLKKK